MATIPAGSLHIPRERLDALRKAAQGKLQRRKERLKFYEALASSRADVAECIAHCPKEALVVPRGAPIRLAPPRVRHLADFHNHWDGILPVDRLIDLYLGKDPELPDSVKKPRDGEEKSSPPLAPASALASTPPTSAPPTRPPLELRREDRMFLRLSDAILEKLKPEGEEGTVPKRGAHLIQYVMMYVWWAVYLEGSVNGYSDGLGPPHPWIGPLDYRALHSATRRAISSLYEAYARPGAALELRRALAIGALNKYLRATKTAPFDDAYVGRGALLKLLGSRAEFDKRTVEYLVDEEHIRYLQVSQPADKIKDPADAIDEFNKAFPDRRITVHWLALIASHRAHMDRPTLKTWEQFKKDTKDAMDAIRARPRAVRGVDWAGPESQEFQLEPARVLVRETLDELHAMARPDRPLVFRPHVGEGSSLLEGGSLIEADPRKLFDSIAKRFLDSMPEWPRMTPEDLAGFLCGHRLARDVLRGPRAGFKVLAGLESDEAARRATSNVGTLIKAIDHYYRGTPPRERSVKLRFGHVTHATREQAASMARLHIAADVNLSSNERTGAFPTLWELDDADVQKRSWGKWNWNLKALGLDPGAVIEHSIVRLCRADVVVVLGSDGQGVESSTMPHEYYLARRLIGDDGFRDVVLQNTLDQQLPELP